MAAIGFIGLGHMGQPMVINLLKAGHKVKVFDINTDAIKNLVARGAQPANSVIDLAKNREIIFTMLQTGQQVMDVCFGNRGVFSNAQKDILFIDCSSIAIGTTLELHREAEKLNLAMVDAPVSGGVKGAENAALTIMVGGSEKNFQKAQPFLASLGKRVIHAGENGKGQVAKICNNMMLAIQMISVCEGFSLGEKLGIDPAKLFEICSHASSQCWSMTSYCPVPNVIDNVPANNDYQPGFAAAMMLKDLRLSQDAAQFVHHETKLGQLATELYKIFAEDKKQAHKDFSAIIEMLRKS